MYKAVTRQRVLNQLLAEHVVSQHDRLKSLRFLCAHRALHLRGIIHEGNERIVGLKTGEIYFDFQLQKEEVTAHTVKMRLAKARFFGTRRPDIIKISTRFSSELQDTILYHLTRGDSPFFMVNKKKRFFGFDLNFILMQIPPEVDVLGKIKIVNCAFEPKRIVWYLDSNLVLQSLVHVFKPDYIEIEQIELETDAQKLLTDINLD
ncbi:hypothetical protein [Turneriella parva]|uniref:Uncharacterized protein n=1 Tax=Turneriella parva (strain ATCC BAA-1111 / DSM 21527 / NCTC 11395 / H) TaxID=869212 RepID=I4B6I0_TURPD|nr:hypothetical protein [Turneriella parva]AFM12887.1 hypothetical protein Turpa_2242 [Turneriella parva DSM 21527]